MSNIDIVARLQLRAEQFSSETGSRFAELKTRAASAAQDVRSSFNASFAEVQKLAATSLKLPRTDAGSLDLSSEIAQLREAAAASDQRAIALRELSVAQSAAAASGIADAEAMRLAADAAAVGSLVEEKLSSTINNRIAALEAVQQELQRTTSATIANTRAAEQAAIADADLTVRAERLLGVLDPVRAAQARFDTELGEATTLLEAGKISTDQYALAQLKAETALRTVADAAGLAAERQAALYAEQAAGARVEVNASRFQGAIQAAEQLGLANKSAAASFAVFEQAANAEQDLIDRTDRLLNSLNPVRAAQARFDAELLEARTLLEAGRIGTDDYTLAQSRAEQALRQVADAAGIAAERKAELDRTQTTQQLADTVLVSPRSATGSLDLSGEITSLKESANALEQRAIASREMAAAMAAAAEAEGVDSAALRANAEAAIVNATADEKVAAAKRAQISSYEATNDELQRSASMTSLDAARLDEVTHASGRTSIAKMELQHVIRASSDAMAAGAPISQVFAMEIGRIAEAASMAGDSLGKIGKVLGGEVGIALSIGAALLTPFVTKLLEGNDALGDEVEKLKASAAQSNVTREAKERFARSVEGVTAAIYDQLAAQGKAIEGERTAAENANINARAQLALEIQTRKTTAAQLEQALVQQRAASGQRFDDSADALNREAKYQGQVTALEEQKKNNDAAIALAQKSYNYSRVDLASEQGKTDADPSAAVTKKYKDAELAARNAARANDALTASLSGVIAGLEKQKQVELDAIHAREHSRKPENRQIGREIDLSQAEAIVASVGGRVTSAYRSTAEQAVLYQKYQDGTGSLAAAPGHSDHERGQALDIAKTGDVTIAKIKQAFEDQGVHIKQLLDEGNHIHIAWSNPGDEKAARAAEEAQRKAQEAAKRQTEFARQSGDEIARINAQWDEQPRLVDRAGIETHKLDEIIADLQARKPPGFEQLIADAEHAKQSIQDGINRPYNDYVKSQRQSLAVQGLILQGREVEANALQTSLRLQAQMGPLSDAQLATILQIEKAQQRIADAIEDQRRVVGLYAGAVGDLEQTFNGFLDGLRSKPGDAFKGLVSGFVGSFEKLQNSLTTEQLFGGMQRDIERYVAQKMGGSTPADMLKEQLTGAGAVLTQHVDTIDATLDGFIAAVRSATSRLDAVGFTPGAPAIGPVASADLMSTKGFDDLTRQIALSANTLQPANDNAPGDIVVTASHAQVAALEKNTAAHMTSAELFSKIGGDMVTRLESMIGVKLPAGLEKTLKEGLGTVLQGASLGQLGGSVFSSITGGKQSQLGEATGGVLGKVAGDALGKAVGTSLGALGKALGPIGGIVGGVLGDLVGGLFRSAPKASAGISVSNGAITATKASGNNSDALSAASSSAGSVAQGLTQIAEQLGAAVTGSTDVKIGTYKGQWRINDHGGAIGGVKGSGAIGFDSEQEAISAAISAALKDGVLSGISAASQKILQSGQDLSTAISKALMIEQIPKDLKAMIDPVGAAIDTLNTKWAKTVAALKEGGATAEQMAQAQELYKLQLDQVKASTDAADKTLQDFKTSLMLGSSSAYSLRDQETTAKANLQPFIDQITAGQAIDQAKYQTAAQAFLDVERQLYGSTQQYFDALDSVQATTNKAIATVDNATPVTSAVADPFASATASSTATTADNTGTANDLLSQVSGQLTGLQTALAAIAANTAAGGGGGSFIGGTRSFVVAA